MRIHLSMLRERGLCGVRNGALFSTSTNSMIRFALKRPLSTSNPYKLADKSATPGVVQQSTPQREIPAATSTAMAQPFSAPLTSTLETQKDNALPLFSSTPAGTPLKGLNYFKNKEDPIAMEDSGYPQWLWTLLSEKKGPIEGQKDQIDPRLYSKSARARQLANKRARQMNRMNPEANALKIPLHEQTVDLPSCSEIEADIAEAVNARNELTRAMRTKRRSDIKEANFLKEMG